VSRRAFLRKLETHEGTGRIEAFSDGVFAIAATLLAMEMKTPRHAHSAQEIVRALVAQWPIYVSYAMSFIYLGIYWSHHHRLYKLFKRTDHVFLKLNILFLLLVAAQPFPTALLGEYLNAHDERLRIATLVYTGVLCVTACAFLGMWVYAAHERRLVTHDLDHDLIRRTTRRYSIAPIAYGIAFCLALWEPVVSLIANLGIALFYLLPSELFPFAHARASGSPIATTQHGAEIS
jgi:uncharacterized membrane protein